MKYLLFIFALTYFAFGDIQDDYRCYILFENELVHQKYEFGILDTYGTGNAYGNLPDGLSYTKITPPTGEGDIINIDGVIAHSSVGNEFDFDIEFILGESDGRNYHLRFVVDDYGNDISPTNNHCNLYTYINPAPDIGFTNASLHEFIFDEFNYIDSDVFSCDIKYAGDTYIESEITDGNSPVEIIVKDENGNQLGISTKFISNKVQIVNFKVTSQKKALYFSK